MSQPGPARQNTPPGRYFRSGSCLVLSFRLSTRRPREPVSCSGARGFRVAGVSTTTRGEASGGSSGRSGQCTECSLTGWHAGAAFSELLTMIIPSRIVCSDSVDGNARVPRGQRRLALATRPSGRGSFSYTSGSCDWAVPHARSPAASRIGGFGAPELLGRPPSHM